MRLSSWSQNACFVHTAIRSAVAPNNDGEIQNTDLSFNHFWFRSTFADDPVWVLCSSRWNPASSHMLTACVSWKRLQVFFFFPHANITEAPSALSWRNIMSEVMTGRCFCARHTAGGAERTTWKTSCPSTVENTHSYCSTLYDTIGSVEVEPTSCYRRVAGSVPQVCMLKCP